MTQPSDFKLSICIATFNRAALIGAALESIIAQATHECEIVVSDNASTDNTERVVSDYARQFDRLRYIRHDTNNGLDRNFDSAVEHARGDYCWLMCDDDLMKPGAVATVLKALCHDLSLVIVNVERCDLTSKVLLPKAIVASANRTYGPEEMDRLFVELGHNAMLICCFVIKREIWIARDRERYLGSMYIHVGVIFQQHLPGETLLIAEPLITYRDHNTRSFWSELFEILMIKWPSLVSSLAISEAAKARACDPEPWRNVRMLLLFRGVGWYSMTDYRRWIRPRVRSPRERLPPLLIALLPGVLVNTAYALYLSVARRQYYRKVFLLFLRDSHFNIRNWRVRSELPSRK